MWNSTTQRLTLFTSRGIIFLIILYFVLLFLPPLIRNDSSWTPSITSYYTVETSENFISDAAAIVLFLQAPLMLILFGCFHDYTPESRKTFSLISLSFIIISVALQSFSMMGQSAIEKYNLQAINDSAAFSYTYQLFDTFISSVHFISATFSAGLAELFLIPAFPASDSTGINIRLTLLVAVVINIFSGLMFFIGREGISGIFMLLGLIIFITFLLFTIRFFRKSKSAGYGE
jgi:hypothetical protein